MSRKERRRLRRRGEPLPRLERDYPSISYDTHTYDRRGSPTYEDYHLPGQEKEKDWKETARRKRGRSRSRSPGSKAEKIPEREYIDEISIVSQPDDEVPFVPSSPVRVMTSRSPRYVAVVVVVRDALMLLLNYYNY